MTTKDTRFDALEPSVRTLKNRSGIPLELAEFLSDLVRPNSVRLILKETIDLVADTPTEMLWTLTGGFQHGTWFDATASETDIIIPKGVAHVEVHSGIVWEASSTGFRRVDVLVNGTSVSANTTHSASDTDRVGQFSGSGVIDVNENDAISILVEHDADSNLEVQAISSLSWFAIHPS